MNNSCIFATKTAFVKACQCSVEWNIHIPVSMQQGKDKKYLVARKNMVIITY